MCTRLFVTLIVDHLDRMSQPTGVEVLRKSVGGWKPGATIIDYDPENETLNVNFEKYVNIQILYLLIIYLIKYKFNNLFNKIYLFI